MRTVRDPLLVTTVWVATVVLTMIGVDLHAMKPNPSPVVTTVTSDEGASDREGTERRPSPLSQAGLAIPDTSWTDPGEAWSTSAAAAQTVSVPASQPPKAGNDLRVFLLNMARAEREHSSLGIHVDNTGVVWSDDAVKSDR